MITVAIRCVAIALATVAAAPALAQQTQPPPPLAQSFEAPPRPWRVGDPAPSFEGLHLGDSEAQVIAVLGQPAAPQPGLDDTIATLLGQPTEAPPVPAGAAVRTLRYRDGALVISLDSTDRVVKILLRKPDGGTIAGIRVGDRLGHVVHVWGEPTAGGGSTGKWPMGDWTLSVRGDMVSNTALRILLAQTPPAPPAPTSPPAPAP